MISSFPAEFTTPVKQGARYIKVMGARNGCPTERAVYINTEKITSFDPLSGGDNTLEIHLEDLSYYEVKNPKEAARFYEAMGLV